MCLTAQEKCALIERKLHIEKSCIRAGDFGDQRTCCLVHQLWLDKLCTTVGGHVGDLIPPRHPGSAYEQQLLLQPSHPGPAPPWLRVSIVVLPKALHQVRFSSSCQRDELRDGLTIAEHWQTIALLNHVHSCQAASSRFSHATGFTQPDGAPDMAPQDSMSNTLRHVYGIDITRLPMGPPTGPPTGREAKSEPSEEEEEEATADLANISRENALPLVCALESDDEYVVVEPYFRHSLRDVVGFSPALLSQSNVRTLFVVYQLLRAVKWYHSRGMRLGAVELEHVKMHRGLWLYLQRAEWYLPQSPPSREDGNSAKRDEASSTGDKTGALRDAETGERAGDVSSLVTQWAQGCISNYDYLTALNRFAGRHMGDPNHHPVFPWVTDFTTPDGGMRNLRKSKYRINKGDRQLDMTYKLAHHDNQDPSGVATVPHHVSDFLSDITYHVYLARRTTKAVLCEHVRSQWVPNEYPGSMERLYQWTPDECIPQFFSDPSIFASIHADLPDLALPEWTRSPDEFVRWHREVLECEAVSQNLHHWIDLTFGYKLSGKAAVKAKNVCLHLTDKHQHITNHGVLQLFTEPHPRKATTPSPLGLRWLPRFENLDDVLGYEKGFVRAALSTHPSLSDSRSQLEESLVLSTESRTENVAIGLAHVNDETHRAAAPLSDYRDVAEGKIELPRNYNPLELLQRFEAVQRFRNQFVRGPDRSEELAVAEKRETVASEFGSLVRLDMKLLGCLMVEMLVPDQCRLVTDGLNQTERKEVIAGICRANPKNLPRFVRSGVLALLNAQEDAENPLPPPTADLLLHHQPGLFPFPSYFLALHEFLAKFYHQLLQGRSLPEGLDTNTHARLNWSQREGPECSTAQVDWAGQALSPLLAKLDDEGFELLFYHLEPLFSCPHTRMHAFIQLFDRLAQALGPVATAKAFTKPLMNIFDSYLLEEYEHLVSQSFLSQIIVRFGLQNFLDHFVNSLVEAVAFKSLIEKADILAADRSARHHGEDRGTGSKAEEPGSGSQDLPSSSSENAANHVSISVGGFEGDEENDEADQRSLDEISGRVSLMPSPKPTDECEDDVFEDMSRDHHVTRETAAVRGDRQRGLGPRRESGVENGKEDPTREDELRKGGAAEMWGKEEEAGGTGQHQTVKGRESEVTGSGDEDAERAQRLTGREDSAEDETASLSGPAKPEVGEVREEAGLVQTTTGTEDLAEPGDEATRPEEATETQDEDGGRKPEFSEESDPIGGEGTLNGEAEIDMKVKATEESGIPETTTAAGVGEERGTKTAACDKIAHSSGEESSTSEEDEDPQDRGIEDGEENEEEERDGDYARDAASFLEERKAGRGSRNFAISSFYRSTQAERPCGANGHERPREELSPGLISGVAVDSVVWLAPRLGPVLTSKFIASQLLRLLGHCYVGEVAFDEDKQYLNDKNAKWVLYCLGKLCALYGDAFMLHQFLPHAERTVKGIKKKITAKGEGAMAGTLALLKYCLPYVSQDSLVDNFEAFFHSVFQPVFRILSSRTLSFPGGPVAREALCYSYVDLITALCRKLGRDLARDLMTAPLQQFFSCFELVHLKAKELRLGEVAFIGVTDEELVTPQAEQNSAEGKEQAIVGTGGEKESSTEHIDAIYKATIFEELRHTFSANMAHHAFVDNCAIMGGKHMESTLPNYALIWNLCCSHDPTLGDQDETGGLGLGRTGEPGNDCEGGDGEHEADGGDDAKGRMVGETDGARAEVPGESKELEREDEGALKHRGRTRTQMWFTARKNTKTEDTRTGDTEANSSSDQYLRGSWLDHWRRQFECKSKVEHFFSKQQVKLQTFTGHSGPVRSLHVQDSEHFFLSSSKDKTVKLWSLSNHGDGTAQSASSWTYYRHARPVFAVTVVESLRRAASCDGSVHLWDPISGSCLGVVETTRNNPVIAMTSMPAPSQCLVVAMTEGTAKFLDLRQSRFAQEWKISTSNVAGQVRDMCSSPDGRWIALGFSSGHVSVLDVRGGLLRSQRRAHTSDVLQVKAFSNNSFVTSSYDQGMFLWKDDGRRLKTLRGQTDPLNSLRVVRDQVLSTSATNRVGVHSLQEDNSEVSYMSCKVGPDLLKGNITCMSYLPLNQLLLLGSDTSNIVLLA